MHGKADLIGRLTHDFDRDDRGGRRTVASIACIGERLGDEREGPTRQAHHRHGSVAVLYVGRLRIEDERAPVHVGQRLALAPVDPLAGVVVTRAAALRRLDALAVEDRGRR